MVVIVILIRRESMAIVGRPRRRVWSVHVDLFVVGGQNADVSRILSQSNDWGGG